MVTNVVLPYSLDDYFQSTAVGSLDKAIGNNLYGINHRQIDTAVPTNKDLYGYTFFTRPQLNLQTDNVRNVRLMAPLLNSEMLSIQNFVRCTLDPRLMTGYRFNDRSVAARKCPLVDAGDPYIPILSNNINSISGWPDVTVPTYTSPPGLFNEAHSMVDGIARNFESFTVDASFRNTRGDPVLYLFYIWLHYMALVFEGKMVPYMDMITENEIDYNTRIYRILLDKQRNKVTKIFSTIAFPISIGTSAFADYNKERPYTEQNKDITVRFQCHGFEAFDDILVYEFNQTTEIFCPEMSDQYRDQYMVKLDPAVAAIFNNRGYPRIDPTTHEMQWWIPLDLYNNRTQNFLNANLLDQQQMTFSDFSLNTGD